MIKYFRKIFILVPLLFIIGGITYFVDPENRFNSDRYAKGIAELMLRGKNVTDVYNFDVRLLEKYYIAGLRKCPDIVVLGSSREMSLNASFLKDTTVSLVNACANSATLEDEMAVYDMFARQGWHPKKLYIGIDPYYFNDNSKQFLYGSVLEYYYDMCNQIGSPAKHTHEFKLKYGDYEELVSPGYLQKSLLFWIGTGNNHTYIATDKRFNETVTKLSDGSITYGKKERDRDSIEVDEMAKGYVSNLAVYFKNYSHLSPTLTNKFEKFIDFIKSQGVDVSILYMPYHPICYQKMIRDPAYKMVLESELYCQNLAHRKKIHYYGSLNPFIYNLKGSDFYDALHLKDPGVVRVLQKER